MTEPPLSDSEIRTLRTMIDRHVREAENRYYQEQFETISSQRHGCLTCFDSDCAVWQTADQNCWKSEKDAIKKERERVSILTPDDADSLISYVESCCYWNTDTPLDKRTSRNRIIRET